MLNMQQPRGGGVEELLVPAEENPRQRPDRRWMKPLALGVVVLALGFLAPTIALPAPGANRSLDVIRAPVQAVLDTVASYAWMAAVVLGMIAALTLASDLWRLRAALRREQIRNAFSRVNKIRPELIRVRARWLPWGRRLSKAVIRYAPGIVIEDVSAELVEVLTPLAGVPVSARHVAYRNRFIVRPQRAAATSSGWEHTNPAVSGILAQLSELLPDVTVDQARTRLGEDGQIELFVATYGATTKDVAPAFRDQVRAILGAKIPSPTGSWSVSWSPEDNTVQIAPAELGASRVEDTSPVVNAVHTQLHALLPALSIDQDLTRVGEDGELLELVATYGTTTKDVSAAFRSRVQTILEGKIPSTTGAWSVNWHPQDSKVHIAPAEPLPERVLNLGLDLIDVDSLKPGEIPFATRPNNTPALLKLHKLPHVLAVGVTGAGKSAFLRTLVTNACALGWRVRLLDPKVLTFLRGFADWPGIDAIAVTGQDMEELMLELKREMDQKYQLLAAGLIREDQLIPTLAVVDEGTEYLLEINEAAAERALEQGKKPSKSPAERATWSRARKGRQSGDQLVIGTQRPDVSFIPGEARDNMTNRIAIGWLKPQAVEMVFGHQKVTQRVFKTVIDPETRTLTEVQIPGRATVDIGNGVEAVQVWWTPDPSESTDPDELAALERLRDQARAALERRLTGPDHLAIALERLRRGETGLLGQVPGTLGERAAFNEVDNETAESGAVVAQQLDHEGETEAEVELLRARDLEHGHRVRLDLDDDLRWVTLTEQPEPDEDDPELLVLDYVDDAGNAGQYSVPENEPVTVQAPNA